MANEYLQRTPTSTGNRRVGTISAWYKINNVISGGHTIFSSGYNTGSTNRDQIDLVLSSDSYWQFEQYGYPTAGGSLANYYSRNANNLKRDRSSWSHILVAFDTTQIASQDRAKIFIDGIRIDNSSTSNPFAQNYQIPIGALTNGLGIKIGNGVGAMQYGSNYYLGELFDYFYVDGQALTPDVFGFYKPGKGYISAGSTQATDFRNGQWVPRKPSSIIQEINDEGGFGVNGFYLPMNDSKNFGADFHCDPNSIITLNEKLPQPRVGVANTASVGLAYTDVLRADPYAANLVLALPFVSDGLSSGFGDYAPSIKGSGSAKTITNNTSVSIANTHGYYGSSVYIDSVNYLSSSSADFAMGTGDFTVEGWINQTGGDTTYGGMFSTQLSNSTGIGIAVARDQVWLGNNTTSYGSISATTTFWPLNQWTHIAVTKSGTTMRVFVNGVCAGITTTATGNIDRQNAAIGRRYFDNSSFTPIAYLQDLRIYKGVAKYTGGFDVPKPYTPVGIATWRAVPDTCQNNFTTWNPLIPSTFTYTSGNFIGTNTGSNTTASTLGITTGKYYAEFLRPPSASFMNNGIGYGDLQNESYTGIGNSSFGVFTGDTPQRVWYGGSAINLPAPFDVAWQSTDIMSIALDLDNKKVWWGKNGQYTSGASPQNGTLPIVNGAGGTGAIAYNVTFDNSRYFVFRQGTSGVNGSIANFGQNPTFSGNTTAGTFTDSNGKGLFKYQPPAGFLALCEDNLPKPTIEDPGKYFKTVLYAGNSSNNRSIVGVGFTPDLVWIKARNNNTNNILFDSVRGPYYLSSSNTGGDNFAGSLNWASNGGLSMVSDGFNVSSGSNESINGSGNNFVAWCWKAGGAAVGNADGSISSQVSVNRTAGFSIVSWSGTGSAGTIGHGLGKTPAFRISKYRDSSTNWYVWHKSLAANEFLMLNQTTAKTGSSSIWNNTLPTSTTISYNTATVVEKFIEYVWAEIEGFSKFGSWVGNGSADGPFVYCGFKPALVLIKSSSDTSNWLVTDSSRNSINPIPNDIYWNLSDAEYTSSVSPDFVSNGFKMRTSNSTWNGSGKNYIFAAFAESPFQTANAK